jgi:hypothetical protein
MYKDTTANPEARLRNLSEKITHRARPLVLEFHIEGEIPLSHGFTGRIQSQVHVNSAVSSARRFLGFAA